MNKEVFFFLAATVVAFVFVFGVTVTRIEVNEKGEALHTSIKHYGVFAPQFELKVLTVSEVEEGE